MQLKCNNPCIDLILKADLLGVTPLANKSKI